MSHKHTLIISTELKQSSMVRSTLVQILCRSSGNLCCVEVTVSLILLLLKVDMDYLVSALSVPVQWRKYVRCARKRGSKPMGTCVNYLCSPTGPSFLHP